MKDKTALNTLAKWMKDNDPTLRRSDPIWAWNLVALIEDLLEDTGRHVQNF